MQVHIFEFGWTTIATIATTDTTSSAINGSPALEPAAAAAPPAT